MAAIPRSKSSSREPRKETGASELDLFRMTGSAGADALDDQDGGIVAEGAVVFLHAPGDALDHVARGPLAALAQQLCQSLHLQEVIAAAGFGETIRIHDQGI